MEAASLQQESLLPWQSALQQISVTDKDIPLSCTVLVWTGLLQTSWGCFYFLLEHLIPYLRHLWQYQTFLCHRAFSLLSNSLQSVLPVEDSLRLATTDSSMTLRHSDQTCHRQVSALKSHVSFLSGRGIFSTVSHKRGLCLRDGPQTLLWCVFSELHLASSSVNSGHSPMDRWILLSWAQYETRHIPFKFSMILKWI